MEGAREHEREDAGERERQQERKKREGAKKENWKLPYIFGGREKQKKPEGSSEKTDKVRSRRSGS